MSIIDRDLTEAVGAAAIGDRMELASSESVISQGDPSHRQRPPSDSTASATSERAVDRVGQFLAAHRPALFCDDCIADKLGLSRRRQANRVTGTLGKTSRFWRAVGACSVCEKHKQVIRHV
jgi:hypothetical protein